MCRPEDHRGRGTYMGARLTKTPTGFPPRMMDFRCTSHGQYVGKATPTDDTAETTKETETKSQTA
jgi:hypothetical protein